MSLINPPYRVKRDPPSVADIIVAGASPLLIVGVVGSLVFFLAEVFYAGKYEGRLLYTLFFFVVGAVFVGRIAVQVDRGRSWAYGIVLAIVTLIALWKWVDYPPDHPLGVFKEAINFGLVIIVWWASNRLVRDCTHLDEQKDASSQGLLAAAGWEKRPNIHPDIVDDVVEDETHYRPGVAGWYQRYSAWKKARDQRPHTPGLSVIYFAIAAIPLFGLGQAIVPADDVARRNFTFWTMACYITSTLGLLLTTSFLGLRRYLRQRKLRMPLSMTASWMGLGALLIIGFVIAGALLPRPYSETPIWNPSRVVNGDQAASNNSVLKSGQGKGEGRTGNETTKGDGQATGKNGEPGAKGKQGEAKKGSGDNQGKNGNSGDQKQGDAKQSDSKQPENQQGKQQDDSTKQKQESSTREQQQASNKENQGQDAKENNSSSPPSSLSKTLSSVATVLKWIVFAVIVCIVLFVIFRHGLSFLANFMPWAKNLLAAIDAWWKGLFGVNDDAASRTSSPSSPKGPTHIPFTAFSNPFADGSASGRSVESLVRYSFEAFEALAADQGCPRQEHETPIEFARRIGEAHRSVAKAGHQLAILLARLIYSNGDLPKNSRAVLEQCWEELSHAIPDEEPAIVEEN